MNNKKRAKKIQSLGVLSKEAYEESNLSEDDGLHENKYRHSISIRLPPLQEQIKFNIIYYVAPDSNERHFFAMTVFMLLGLSILVALVGFRILDYNTYPFLSFLRPIGENLNALLGGIVTISLAIIGLLKNPFMDRTRFWFLPPIIISSLTFLIQGLFTPKS